MNADTKMASHVRGGELATQLPSRWLHRTARLLACCFLGFTLAASAQTSPEIFREIQTPAPSAAATERVASGPFVVRERYVEMAVSHVLPPQSEQTARHSRSRGPEGASLTFNLFNDAVYEFEETRAEYLADGKSFLWLGRNAEDRLARATLVVREGRVVGNVVTPNGDFYRIRAAGEGMHVIRQVVYQGSPAVDDAVPLPKSEMPQAAALQMTPRAAEQSAPIIDLMVVYTSAALQAAGGVVGIESEIQLAVAEINQGYVNSAVQMEVRLVHTAEVDYDEQVDLLTSLTRLQSTSDGHLDEVHSLRDQYGADVVALLINGPGSGGGTIGIAYIMSSPGSYFASWAFSVTEVNFATGPTYTLAHETGHNLGCDHDRENSAGGGAYSYSRGYQQPTSPNQFRTIMSYNCTSVNCPVINHWSNPDVTYLDKPTGIPSHQENSADNRLTLNNTGPIATDWRQSVDVEAAPVAVSVSPATGNGASQTFSYTFSDENGFSDLVAVQLLVNETLKASSGCYLYYSRASNSLYLVNDAGTVWMGPVTLGASGTLSNSQCGADAGSSSFSASGNDLTVNIALSFQAGFAGSKTNYMLAADTEGLNSGWRARGTWTVPGVAINVEPVAVAVTPSSGSGTSQTFTYEFSDPNGFSDIASAQFVINGSLQASGACYLYYGRAANALYLSNDSGTAWMGPVNPGASGTLSNSQCSVNAEGSSVSAAETTLQISLAATFLPEFAGSKTNHAFARDAGGLSTGWQTLGAWTVLAESVNQAPLAAGVTPSAGTGLSQTFSFSFSDPNGYTDLPAAQLVIGTALSANGSCYLFYSRSRDTLYLSSDAGSAWLGPITLGSSSTVENSQCAISGAGSSSSGVGTNLTINVATTFKAGFAGSKNLYMYAQDTAGLATGWQHRGTWTVP